jgi:serine/threonine protein kinase
MQYLHRDVKPENFLMELGKRGNLIYMTDLGLAIYRQPDHIMSGSTSVRNPQLIGTCRYASINSHLGVGGQYSICHNTQAWLTSVAAQSRGDDLEALGYMMLYSILGSLPWQGLKAPTLEQKYRLVLEKKQTTSVAELRGDLPQEIAIYMNYVRNLRHEEKPDYRYIQRIFRNLFRRQGFEYDQVFDWTIREYQRQSVQCAKQSPATRNVERICGEKRGEQPEGPSRHIAKRRRRKRT